MRNWSMLLIQSEFKMVQESHFVIQQIIECHFWKT